MKRKILYAVLAFVTIVAVAVVGGSFYMLDYALDNSNRQKVANYDGVMNSYPETRPWLDSLRRDGMLRDTFVVMPSGERHHAIFVRSANAHGRTAVIVHGYKDSAVGMLHIAYIYNKVMGYNILLPDLHGHGESGGDDVRMGWKDRIDVLHWMGVAERVFRTPADTSRMIVHGISMGAATVMNVSGEKTPEYVRCFVEDCGYTNVWDEFAHEMKKRFGLPPFPLLYTSSAFCEMRHGWNFVEASPLSSVAKCEKPMLFIHGDKDDFVPAWMVRPCYDAKPQPKELWVARGSGHAVAYRDHKEAYVEKVRGFARRWMY